LAAQGRVHGPKRGPGVVLPARLGAGRECLADALETKDAFGVRGGFTPQERATLARLGVGQ